MDDNRHSHRRWGVLAAIAGLAIAVAGVWLGSSVDWDLAPTSDYVNRPVAATRAAIAAIVLGTIVAVVGASVAFAPYGRR
jgi:hypothetical protein